MIRQPLLALSFLTRIPVASGPHLDPAYMARSARWFPLVGFVLGSLYAGAARLLSPALPPSVIAVLLLILDALLTGALHMDGLADMADGFGGGRTRADTLRIMRDHAIGSYGATALTLLLLLKATCLSELLAREQAFSILCTSPALARWAMVLLSWREPYARSEPSGIEPGTGALAKWIGKTEFALATVISLPLLLFGVRLVLPCWAAVTIASLLLARWCRCRIGGITGDVLGATAVTSEALQFLIALLLLYQHARYTM